MNDLDHFLSLVVVPQDQFDHRDVAKIVVMFFEGLLLRIFGMTVDHSSNLLLDFFDTSAIMGLDEREASKVCEEGSIGEDVFVFECH